MITFFLVDMLPQAGLLIFPQRELSDSDPTAGIQCFQEEPERFLARLPGAG